MMAFRCDQFGNRYRSIEWEIDGTTVRVCQPGTGGFSAEIELGLFDLTELVGQYCKSEALLLMEDRVKEVFGK